MYRKDCNGSGKKVEEPTQAASCGVSAGRRMGEGCLAHAWIRTSEGIQGNRSAAINSGEGFDSIIDEPFWILKNYLAFGQERHSNSTPIRRRSKAVWRGGERLDEIMRGEILVSACAEIGARALSCHSPGGTG